jgi:V-type H+-transporting ATPase subunit C
MASNTRYSLVSLPLRLFDSGDKEGAVSALIATISADSGTVWQFNVPDFKIGTLDTLVQQAEELGKLSTVCEGVVAKIGESLRSILDGDDEKLEQQKMVNDSRLGTSRALGQYPMSLITDRRTHRAVSAHIQLE